MRKLAKIFLRHGELLLFSIKRSPAKPWKDNRLELIGGGIEPGETPLEGLIRELSEEEATGILADKARRQPLLAREVLVGEDPHFIYEMALTAAELAGVRMDPAESRGHRVIHESEIQDDPERFTPKSILIFRALKLVA